MVPHGVRAPYLQGVINPTCSITSMLLVVIEALEGIDRLNTKYSN